MSTSSVNGRTLFACILLSLICTATAWADSRCTERKAGWFTPGKISCPHLSTPMPSAAMSSRKVLYQIPVGTPPPGGWPVVIIYQGSFAPLNNFVYSSREWLGRLFNEGKLIKTLLDNGYAVIAPSAPGDLFWQTNIPGLGQLYNATSDYSFISNLLQRIADGQFGPLNPNRKYATGISSGGYNTSRMAVSFPGQFKALAIQSASYATCAGPLCVVPELPADHPPTTFLHGMWDLIIPWWTMNMYYDRLLYQGIETSRYLDPMGAHGWLSAAPRHILNWFNAHP